MAHGIATPVTDVPRPGAYYPFSNRSRHINVAPKRQGVEYDRVSPTRATPQEALDRWRVPGSAARKSRPGRQLRQRPLSIPNRLETTCRVAGGHIQRELFEEIPHGFAKTPVPESGRAVELMKGLIASQLSRPVVAKV